MRYVDHDAPLVHLGNRLAAEVAEPAMEPHVVALTCVRVGELAVAVVGERHVAAAALGKVADVVEVGAERVRVLDADHRDLSSGGDDTTRVVGGQRESDTIRRDLIGETVDRVELRNRLGVRVRVTLLRERALADVHDHPRHVEPTRLHVGKVDLSAQVGRVVALGREVRRIYVVVRIERDDPLVDAASTSDEVGLTLNRGLTGARRHGEE